MSRAIRVETRSRHKDDIKRAMHSIVRARKWEKKWVRIGETSMHIFKWMPLNSDGLPELDKENILSTGIESNEHSSSDSEITNATTNKQQYSSTENNVSLANSYPILSSTLQQTSTAQATKTSYHLPHNIACPVRPSTETCVDMDEINVAKLVTEQLIESVSSMHDQTQETVKKETRMPNNKSSFKRDQPSDSPSRNVAIPNKLRRLI